MILELKPLTSVKVQERIDYKLLPSSVTNNAILRVFKIPLSGNSPVGRLFSCRTTLLSVKTILMIDIKQNYSLF